MMLYLLPFILQFFFILITSTLYTHIMILKKTENYDHTCISACILKKTCVIFKHYFDDLVDSLKYNFKFKRNKFQTIN